MSIDYTYKTILVDIEHENKYVNETKFLVSCFQKDEYGSVCSIQSYVRGGEIIHILENCSDQVLFTPDALSFIYNTCEQKILSNNSDRLLSTQSSHHMNDKVQSIQKLASKYTLQNMLLIDDEISYMKNKMNNSAYINRIVDKLLDIENKQTINEVRFSLISNSGLIKLSNLFSKYGESDVKVFKSTNLNKMNSLPVCNKDMFGSIFSIIFSSPGLVSNITTDYKDEGLMMQNFAKFMLHNDNVLLDQCIVFRALNSIRSFDSNLDQGKELSLSIILAQTIIKQNTNQSNLYKKVHNNKYLLNDQYFITITDEVSKILWLALTLYNNSDVLLGKIDTIEFSMLMQTAYKSIKNYAEILIPKKDNENNLLKEEIINLTKNKIKNMHLCLYEGQLINKSSGLSSEVSTALLLTNGSNNIFNNFLKSFIYNKLIYNPNIDISELKFNYLQHMFMQYNSRDPICMIFIRLIDDHIKAINKNAKTLEIIENESVNNSIIPYVLNKENINFKNSITVILSRLTVSCINTSIQLVSKLSLLSYKLIFLSIASLKQVMDFRFNKPSSS